MPTSFYTFSVLCVVNVFMFVPKKQKQKTYKNVLKTCFSQKQYKFLVSFCPFRFYLLPMNLVWTAYFQECYLFQSENPFSPENPRHEPGSYEDLTESLRRHLLVRDSSRLPIWTQFTAAVHLDLHYAYQWLWTQSYFVSHSRHLRRGRGWSPHQLAMRSRSPTPATCHSKVDCP